MILYTKYMGDNSKEQLIISIKEYVSFDRQIKERQNEIKVLKQKQKEISNSLMEVMRSNEIDCFDINNGRILYKKSKTKKAISKGFLNEILEKYFNGDRDKVEDLGKYILTNRIEVERETIMLKPDKV
jgi:hypothetical protein